MLACQKCGWDNPDYAAFCTNCGNQLSTSGNTSADVEHEDVPFATEVVSDEAQIQSAPDDEAVAPTNGPGVDAAPKEIQLAGASPGVSHGPVGGVSGGAQAPQPNRTLVDLTTPDFRAMVNLAQGPMGEENSPDDRSGEQSSNEEPRESEEGGPGGESSVDSKEKSLAGHDSLDSEELDRTAAPDDDSAADTPQPEEAVVQLRQDNVQASRESVVAENNGVASELPQTKDEAPTPISDGEQLSHGVEHKPDAIDAPSYADATADSMDSEPESDVQRGASIRDLGSLDIPIEMLDSNDVLPSLDNWTQNESTHTDEQANEADEGDDPVELSSIDLSPIDLVSREVTGADTSSTLSQSADVPPPIPVRDERFVLRCLSDGVLHNMTVPIGEEPIVIGRTQGEIRLESDPYASPRHASVVANDGGVRVEDSGSQNGVWSRIRGRTKVTVGDEVLMGTRIFAVQEWNQSSSSVQPENGTRPLGVAKSRTSFQLAEIATDGLSSSVHAVPMEGLRIGRQTGDIILTDDPYLSGAHAIFLPNGLDGLDVKDLSGGNGCWLRMKKPAVLCSGDAFLVGRTIWRVGETSQ